MKTYSLACGHRYCFDCYQHYVSSKITDYDIKIQCMHTQCKLRFDDAQVKKIIKEGVAEKFDFFFFLLFLKLILK